MNWKNEAVDRLRRYEAMCAALGNIEQELERLEAAAGALRSASAVRIPVMSSNQSREDKLLDNIVCRQELENMLEQTKSWLEITQRALMVLKPQERTILHRLFIRPEDGNLSQLCKELSVEQSSVYRKRDKALRTFTMALYGAELS